MEPNLRPMTLGEILDRTAQLYREKFVLFAGIFVLYAGCALVLGLVALGLNEWARTAHRAVSVLVWMRLSISGLQWLVLFLVAGAAVAATNRAVAWVHLGEPATIRGAYQSIMPRLSRYLWLMTAIFFIVWTPIAVLYAGFFGSAAYFRSGLGLARAGAAGRHAAVNPHAAMMFGIITAVFVLLMIPAAVYAILMGLRYALSLPACVLEDLKTGKALRRGVELSKGGRGRIFVLGLLVGVLKLAVISASQAFILVAAFRHHGQVGAGMTAVSEIISFFTNTFLGPIYATGITLLYYDQRVRREGYDIEWMMQAAGLMPPAQAAGAPLLETNPAGAAALGSLELAAEPTGQNPGEH